MRSGARKVGAIGDISRADEHNTGVTFGATQQAKLRNKERRKDNNGENGHDLEYGRLHRALQADQSINKKHRVTAAVMPG